MSRRSHVRRLFAVLGSAAVAIAMVLMLVAPAGAATPLPIPAGETTIQFTGTLTVPVGGTPTEIPFTGQMVGTSDGAGTITFPISGTSFPDVPVTIVVPAIVHFQATTAFTMTLDEATNVATLKGSMLTVADIPDLNATGCPLGPIALNLSSTTAGGSAYNPANAKTTVADRSFTVPAITNPPASCPIAAVINGAFPLPITGDASRSVVQAITVFAPGQTAPTTTTVPVTVPVTAASTVPPAPPATVAPVAVANDQLPRTGSSSTPLALLGVAFVGGGLALVLSKRRFRTG